MAAPQQQPQTQAVAQKQARPVDMLKTMINADSVQQQFRNALGNHKDAFVASLIDLYTGDKQLQTCKPQAVIAEALRAATMNLPLNKALGQAYIIVFNNKGENGEKVPTPSFIIGYKGLMQLAQRTGQYQSLHLGGLPPSNKVTISTQGASFVTKFHRSSLLPFRNVLQCLGPLRNLSLP